MYNLRECSLSQIIGEMEDFKPLKDRMGVYCVTEKFVVDDTVFEVDDMVVLCGDGTDIGLILFSYEKFKRIPTQFLGSFDMMTGYNKLLISINTFHKRFKLDIAETNRIEKYIDKAKVLYAEKNKISKENNKIKNDKKCFFMAFIKCFFMAFIATIFLSVVMTDCTAKKFNYFIYIAACIFYIYIIVEAISILRIEKSLSYVRDDYYAKCLEVDKEREQEGLYFCAIIDVVCHGDIL